MSLIENSSIRFFANNLNSFKKPYQLSFVNESSLDIKSLENITVMPSSWVIFTLTFPKTLSDSLYSKSKKRACEGSLMTSPASLPIVILGKRPRILLKRSSPILSSSCILYLSTLLIVCTNEDRHGCFVICYFFGLRKGIIYAWIPIFKHSHHSNSK